MATNYSHASFHKVAKVEITSISHHHGDNGPYDSMTLWLYGDDGHIVHYIQIYSADNSAFKANVHPSLMKEPETIE